MIDRTLHLYQECASEDAAACRSLLEGVRHAAGDSKSTVALITSATQRLQRLTAATAFAEDPEELHTAVDPRTGTMTSEGQPAVALTAPAGELESLEAWLVAGRLDEPALLSSSVAEFGAIAQLLPAGSKARIAVWHLSGAPAALSVVGAEGVDAILPCTVSWAELIEAIRLTLNLRATAAVTKFLFNDLFDFSDVAPRIAQILAGPIKAALAALPESPTAFHISGLSRRQSWLARELAGAVGLPHWEPDAKVILQSYGVSLAPAVSATALPLAILPLLHAAVAETPQGPWLAPWRSAQLALNQRSAPLTESAPATTTPVVKASVPTLEGSASRVAWSASPVVATVVETIRAGVTTALATPPPVVMPPPRPTVRIGARKLVLAPHTPSPLTGWPQPVQCGPPVEEDHSAPVADATSTPDLPCEITPPVEPPAPSPSTPAPPANRPRGRQRVLYMAGVAVVLAAVNAVTYFHRAPSPVALPPSSPLTIAPQADGPAMADTVNEDLAITDLVESAPSADSPAATLSSMELGHPSLPWLSASTPTWLPAPLQASDDDSAERDFFRRWWGGEPTWQFIPAPSHAGRASEAITPAPSTGALQIVSDGKDWVFRLTNHLGDTRVVSSGFADSLPTGEYVLEVARPGWRPLQEKLQISAGTTTTITPRFTTGRLLIRTQPEGAEVYLNGHSVGRTPVELTELPTAAFELVLSLADHDDVRLGGEIMAGATTELSFQLDRLDRLARVSELAEPPVATVRVAPNFRRLPLIKSGRVLLSFIIDRTGTPSAIRVEDASDRRLVRPCLEVITKWQFSPGINREGKPVNTRVHQLFQVAWEE